MSYRGQRFTVAIVTGLTVGLTGCGADPADRSGAGEGETLLARYATVTLSADLTALTPAERDMIPILIDAADQMDAVFWQQAFGHRDSLLATIDDPALRQYAEINYGPWDRLENDAPFVPGVGPKPAGANFYPPGLLKEDFEAAAARDTSLPSLYTLVRRAPDGLLTAIPYHEAYPAETRLAADKLREAAALAADSGLRRYLELRAEALLRDDYRESDLAWLDMKTNTLEVVIGPIETYEDQLFGYKAAHEAYILIKDHDWSRRLERYAAFLPDLQRGLPVPDRYKRETPGTEGDLNAYDAIYYAGHANAGPKTIAINLPNDEEVQLRKGTRRLQLKNTMRAKFDNILVPIADLLIAPDQRAHVTFDAFFANTMFHEVAHGLGIKNTLTTRGTVREALREHASAMEEGKADVLGLYMVTALADRRELEGADLRDHYVTFLASIFRSVRFGASSAHGRANMVRFNDFAEAGAFSRTSDGSYRVDFDRMREAVESLAGRLLIIQGDGDHAAAGALLAEKGMIGPDLQADLDRLETLGIPIDIVFRQGMAVLR